MSYLDQFLKETNSSQQHHQQQQQQQQQHMHAAFAFETGSAQQLHYLGTSIESEEGDIEDNRAQARGDRKT